MVGSLAAASSPSGPRIGGHHRGTIGRGGPLLLGASGSVGDASPGVLPSPLRPVGDAQHSTPQPASGHALLQQLHTPHQHPPPQPVVPPPPLVLIHDIRAADQAPRTPPLERARLRARGVHVFDSYIEAALVCFEAGLLDAPALRALVDGVTGELAAVAFSARSQSVARLGEWQTAMQRADMAMAARAGAAPR